MRNLKKYLSVLLAVAMILTAMAPAFAAGFTYEAQGQALKDLGIIEGVSPTDLGLGLDLNREQGIKVVLGLVGKLAAAEALTDAEATAALANYTDVATVSGWAKKYVAYSVKNGIVNGMDATTLAPQVKLSGKMFATMILRNLGYTVNDNDYANAAGILAEKGALTATQALAFNNKDLIRDDMAAIAFGALKVKDAAGKTVIENLVAAGVVTEAKAIAAGLLVAGPTPTPVPFTVVSAKADNLKQIVVSFSEPVDEDSAENPDNYKLDDVTLTSDDPLVADDEYTKIDLSDDGLSVTITLTDAEVIDTDDNQGEVDLYVDGVESVDGDELDEVELKVLVDDAAVPVAKSIELTGPNKFLITFSEPIESTGTVKVGDDEYGVSETEADLDEVTVTLGDELADGDYKVDVYGFGDYAGLNSLKKSFTLKYAAVTTAPTAKITEATQKKVEIEFNRDVFAGDPDDVAELSLDYFYHTFKTYNPDTIDWDGKDTVTLNFTTNYLPEGKVKVVVLKSVEDIAGDDVIVTDAWGNELENDIVLYATISADNTKPTVTKIEAEDQNTVEIYFSEDVTGAADASNFVLKDEDGEEIELTDGMLSYNANDDDDEYITTITFAPGDELEGEYTIEIKDIKDVSVDENEITTVTKSFTVEDETSPSDEGLTTAVYVQGDDDVIYVTFPEDMATSGAYSILDKDKYLVNGEELADDDKVELFNGDTDKVKITIKAATDFDFSTNTVDLTIGRVADKSGVKSDMSTTVNNILEASAPSVDEVKVVDYKTIKITFPGELKTGLLPTHIKTSVDGTNWYSLASIKSVVYDKDEGANGETYVTAGLASASQLADLKDNKDTLVPADALLVQAVSGKVKSIFGKAIESIDDSPINVTPVAGVKDGYAPYVYDAEDDVVATVYGIIEITFTEDLDAGIVDLMAQDLVILDDDGEELVAGVDYETTLDAGDASVLVITFYVDGVETDFTGDIKIKSKDTIKYIRDDAGNKAKAFTETQTLDFN